MKSKKFISGLLAGAMVLTSVATFGVSEAEAAGEDGLVAYYTFEDSLANTVGEADDTATPMKARVDESSEMTEGGTAAYEAEGFKGSAIRLNDYGLRLNKKNLGDNFTVSMWLKSDGTFPENQVLMFLGNHNPEKWIAVCGGEPLGGNSSLVKFWARDVEDATSNPTPTYSSHTTLSTMNIAAGEWHKLTVTGSESTVTAYLDGEAVAYSSGQDGTTNHPLVGESQDIYIGVNNWDTEFTGLVDEVKVYDTTATAEEVQKDYLRDIGEPEGFKTATFSFEDSLANSEGGDDATPMKARTGGDDTFMDEGGTAQYVKEGFKGSAIRLDDYGLRLNQKNLGENFSVSMWLKPDGTFAQNQVVAFLGYHNPEQWIAVSGMDPGGTATCKFWANGNGYGTHTTLAKPVLSSDGWHQLTITGSSETLTAYVDGVPVAYESGQDGKTNHPLVGENQDIYIGVNNWDMEFTGLVDEVQVYQYTLTEEQVAAAYNAEMADPEEDKLAEYTFEESIADNKGNQATAIVTGLGAYSGEVKYEAGFRGDAVRLGDYGLKLNKQNLGKDFTVSMWVKPDGTFAENQVTAFLGYHSPEKWIGVSGNKSGTANVKFWGLGNGFGTHTTIGTTNLNSGAWHQLTITGTDSTITAYLDGQQFASGTSNDPLDGTDQDIYLGVNNWDNEFSGLMDDVEIYGRALTAGEISEIYVTDLLSADEAALTVPAEVKWDMTLPAAGNSGQTTITWTSDNAAIDAATGKVTRPENGQENAQVTLTATITSGGRQVVKAFTVTVFAEDPDSDIKDYADWLSLNAGFVSADFSLPQTVGKATVAWSSNDPAITIDGTDAKVTRPDGENKAVTLTATVSLDGTTKTVTKEFPLTVLADGPDLLTYISNAPATGQNGGMKIAGESDGSYSVLHSNQPILYASKGTKSLSSAQIFRAADGSFGVVAADGGNNGNLILFDSKDLITYSNERMLSVPGVSAIKEVNCVYDSADKVYRIFIQDGNDKVWMAESADLTAIDSVAAGDYSFPSVTGTPSDAVNPWTAALTQAEYDAVVKKFSSIQNTGVTAPEDIEVTEGEEVELPETVTAQYSDGSTKQLGVVWDEEDLANVGSDGSGNYTVKGTVQRTISYTDPEEPLIEERADPFMTYDAERGKYYFTGSYPTNGKDGADGYDRLVIREADTIDGLQTAQETVIWDESWDDGSGNSYSQWIWAPEIHKIGNYWYIISTAGTNGGNRFGTLRPFMMRCNNPDDITNPDSWNAPERVKPMAGDEKNCLNAMSLDMTYFEAEGKSYLAWADFTQTGISSIYIATIDPSNPTQLTSPCTIISRPEYSWEYVRATVNEGPAVFKSNGKVYMAFSASGTGSEYCVGLLTANEGEDLLDAGSWVKSNYPVLTSTDFNDEVSGPGHNSFTVDEYGNVIIVYHARPAEIHAGHGGDPLQDPCRYAYLQPVNIAADGSPVLNMTPEQELADGYQTISVTIKVSESSDTPGTIEDATSPEDNAGNAALADDEETLGSAVLTDEDKTAVENGADASIRLDVEDITESVPAEDAGLVEEAKGEAELGMYLGVTLWKQIGDGEEVAVTETNGSLTISFEVPDSLINTDPSVVRSYQIIRVHEGKAEIIPCEYSEETRTITFKTDKFSTYALVYTDREIDPQAPVLTDIQVTAQPTKTTYTAGETFDPAGMTVTASYDKGEPAVIALDKLTFAPEVLTEGTEEVIVYYTENGVTKTASIPVTVNGETDPTDPVDPEDPDKDPVNPEDPDKDPADPQKPGTSTPAEDDGGAVQTGDTTNILPTAAVMIFALAGATAVVILKKRKRG